MRVEPSSIVILERKLYGGTKTSTLPIYQLKTLYVEILLWRLYNEARSERVGYGLRKRSKSYRRSGRRLRRLKRLRKLSKR